jgi:Domain of unknown function (DUF4157)
MVMIAKPVQTRSVINSCPPLGWGILQRRCACGGSAGLAGECAECQSKRLLGGPLQTKLRISEPVDEYEQEADRVGEQIVRMPEPTVKVHNERSSRAPLAQRRVSEGGVGLTETPSIVHGVLSSLGQPLDAATRTFFEPRFGHDFSHVRIHADARAAESARSVNALAYTVGRDVVFGVGQYAPGTAAGQQLLAHELTHTIQQQSAPLQATDKMQMGDETSALGMESERAKPGTASASLASGPRLLQRKTKDGECTWSEDAYHCATGMDCLAADDALVGPVPPSTWWTLTVKIDIEAPSGEDVSVSGNWGHTFLKFSESNGNSFTYGFYPAEGMGPTKTRVNGCLAHPDTIHEPCVDYETQFSLTEAEYNHALANVMAKCAAPPKFDAFNYNCTSFANEVVRDAGKSLPPIRGKVTFREYEADNPNTLLEALRARDIKRSGFEP